MKIFICIFDNQLIQSSIRYNYLNLIYSPRFLNEKFEKLSFYFFLTADVKRKSVLSIKSVCSEIIYIFISFFYLNVSFTQTFLIVCCSFISLFHFTVECWDNWIIKILKQIPRRGSHSLS